MYTKILKELRSCTDLKGVYQVLRGYTRQFKLSYDQVEYLLYQYSNDH